MVPGRAWGAWLQPQENTSYRDDEFGGLVNLPIDFDTVIVHTVPDYYSRWRAREPDKRMIGMTVWELDKLPAHWAGWLNPMDAILLPCQWNCDVFTAADIKPPIEVIPHLTETLRETLPLQLSGISPNDFVFYSIAAWRERNAPHLTLASYLSEFSADDNAILIIKTSTTNERRRNDGFWRHRVLRHFETVKQEASEIIKASASTARVAVVTEDWSDARIAALHDRGDCYVSLTRAEGWGLGSYEAAQAAKPVIITGHGGQMDFLPAELSFHVNYQLVPFSEPHLPNNKLAPLKAHWAEPDQASAGRLMRQVFTQPKAAAERGKQLQQHIREHFDNQKIIHRMLHFIQSLPMPDASK